MSERCYTDGQLIRPYWFYMADDNSFCTAGARRGGNQQIQTTLSVFALNRLIFHFLRHYSLISSSYSTVELKDRQSREYIMRSTANQLMMILSNPTNGSMVRHGGVRK